VRILFVPGLGEEPFIFDKIQEFVPGEKVFIDNWKVLKDVPEKGLNVLVYARFLVERFEITKEDVVIGHSMGAWVAWYIKQAKGCRAVQIAGWTDSQKIMKVPLPRPLMFRLAKIGFGFNRLSRYIIVWLHYRNKPSREIFISIFERLRRGNKLTVAKQLMIIFNPVREPMTVMPDLRIHAKEDRIVKFPREPFHDVPGDHFTLFTHPDTVYHPIVQFLKRQK